MKLPLHRAHRHGVDLHGGPQPPKQVQIHQTAQGNLDLGHVHPVQGLQHHPDQLRPELVHGRRVGGQGGDGPRGVPLDGHQIRVGDLLLPQLFPDGVLDHPGDGVLCLGLGRRHHHGPQPGLQKADDRGGQQDTHQQGHLPGPGTPPARPHGSRPGAPASPCAGAQRAPGPEIPPQPPKQVHTPPLPSREDMRPAAWPISIFSGSAAPPPPAGPPACPTRR